MYDSSVHNALLVLCHTKPDQQAMAAVIHKEQLEDVNNRLYLSYIASFHLFRHLYVSERFYDIR